MRKPLEKWNKIINQKLTNSYSQVRFSRLTSSTCDTGILEEASQPSLPEF